MRIKLFIFDFEIEFSIIRINFTLTPITKVELDNRNVGSKNWDWIKKGVPIRLEVGRGIMLKM